MNFTLQELIKSETATANKINNYPLDVKIFDNLMILIVECLQPIRNMVCKPMIISSGFRCPKLNKIVGGKDNSQHLTGQAVDFQIKDFTTKEAYEYIKKGGFYYDQLILEYSKGKTWVHISYNKGKNRRQNLIYQNGKYVLEK